MGKNGYRTSPFEEIIWTAVKKFLDSHRNVSFCCWFSDFAFCVGLNLCSWRVYN